MKIDSGSPGNEEASPFQMQFVEPEPEPALVGQGFDLMERVAALSGRTRPDGKRDKILVLHSIGQRDVHAEEIVAELASRGAPVYFFHTDDFIRRCSLSIDLENPDQYSGVLKLPAGDLALEEVKSVWFRGPEISLGDPLEQAGSQAEFVWRETDAALFGMLGVLSPAAWVNHPDAVRLAEDKLGQLRLAQSLGLTIPRTLVTNDPGRASAFYDACGGEVILKTFRRLAFYEDGRERLILTNRLQPYHLEQIEHVRAAPCFFQENVPKAFELRVTVVGQRVFAAEIHSQESPLSRVDYRRYDFANTPYLPHILTLDLQTACIRILQHYGLSYGAIDMIRRPDGETIFLELNANAQFLWIQDLTGLPIRQAVADLLLS